MCVGQQPSRKHDEDQQNYAFLQDLKTVEKDQIPNSNEKFKKLEEQYLHEPLVETHGKYLFMANDW